MEVDKEGLWAWMRKHKRGCNGKVRSYMVVHYLRHRDLIWRDMYLIVNMILHFRKMLSSLVYH